MVVKITDYNAICNLGADINEIYTSAINGVSTNFELCEYFIKSKKIRIGSIKCALDEIKNKKHDLRCNRILLKALNGLNISRLLEKYSKNKIGVVVATTNTGVDEFEKSGNIEHAKIANPADFIKEYLGLNSFNASVSTACSSGIKAFSFALELLNSGFCDAVIVAGTDAISKIPIFGFDSLEILSNEPCLPFSKNRKGMNIAEGAAVFVVEKDADEGIEISGIGETTDFYHSTTPNPAATEAIKAIKTALAASRIKPCDVDYINLHGTGTYANDIMEGRAICEVFGANVPASSTKPLTGHCLGAAACIEVALCCKLLEKGHTPLYPHIYDGEYDGEIPKIKLVNSDEKTDVKIVLCTSFGFGGTNAAMVLGGF